MNIEFSFPITRMNGPFKVIGKASAMETAEENALWQYNSAIAHDGYGPVESLPSGTTRKEID